MKAESITAIVKSIDISIPLNLKRPMLTVITKCGECYQTEFYQNRILPIINVETILQVTGYNSLGNRTIVLQPFPKGISDDT